MDEGPEPHEWVEKAAEEHHNGHEGGTSSAGREMTLSAITAAVLAVLAAFASLLSGHAAKQAKSTKQQLYEVGGKLIEALAPALAAAAGVADPRSTHLRQFQEERDRYDHEKNDIKKEAEHLEAKSRHEFHKHHQFALGIACFQVGIVPASVSILVRLRAIYYLSILAGLAGLV
jgi:hypothetical protein